MKVKFFKPYISGKEITYVQDILDNQRVISGDGLYTNRAQKFLEKRHGVPKVLLTTSGTTALEMAVRLLHLNPGDEVIAPSFTFSSTINAILLQRATVRFAEIQPDTLNIDPIDVERKITKHTKAIMVVHYAGVACDMEKIMNLAKRYNLRVVEDAAQAIDAKCNNRYLGTIGDFGCLSFHETKNIVSGEGGALYINNPNNKVIEEAEIIREKGTNRNKFFRGQIDKYTWVSTGSSYLPSDILAGILVAQLESMKKINTLRHNIYDQYMRKLKFLEETGLVVLPTIPTYSHHNAHIFYTIFQNSDVRNFMLSYLQSRGIQATFHYIPLHSSPQGRRLGYHKGDFPITERVSATLIRLPIWAGMRKEEVCHVIRSFIGGIQEYSKSV